MKSMICLLALLLVGCAPENRALTRGMELRDKLLSAQSCSFQAAVTADYGDAVNQFSMNCQADQTGKIRFEITEPESISGIRGSIADTGGQILFEEEALYFPLLTDDQLTPASSPWIFLKSLRGGCITSACQEESLLHLTLDDSYEEDALMLDVWVTEDGCPARADIFYDGRRILSLNIENFVVS